MRKYADVEYFGAQYKDAECLNGVWYRESPLGEVHSFPEQKAIKVLNDPQPDPRHRHRTVPPRVRVFFGGANQG